MAASLQSSNAGSPSLKTSFNGAFSRTISFTVGAGSNQVLVVKWCTDKFEAYSISSWTFNGDALTIAGTTDRATVNFVQIAYLKAPDQGTYDLVLTTPSDQHNLGTIIIELWQDVDQSDTPTWAESENSSATSYTSGATVNSGYVATTAITGNFSTTTTNGGTTDILANQATYSGKNASFGYRAAGQPGWTWTGSAQVAGGTLVLKDAATGTGLTPDAGAITITGHAPAVAQTGGQSVTPDAGSIAITGHAPTVARTTLASITTPVLKNNDGVVLANETGVVVNVYHQTTGALVVQKTGQTSNASGIMTILDAALSSGTTYAYEVVLPTNGRRLPVAAAA